MLDASKKSMGWCVFKNHWLDVPLQIHCGQMLSDHPIPAEVSA